jgi:hypothetical protein
MRRNALLAKPPDAVHRLDARGSDYARHVLGRRPTAADYDGVHTTTSMVVAAAYAMGAWSKRRDASAYPVILTLDTSGLQALPDIDALVQGYSVMGDMRRELRDALAAHDDDVDAIVDEFSDWEGAIEADGGVGDHPSVFVFEHVAGEPVTSFIEALREQGRDDDEVIAALRAWADRGDIDPAALTTIMQQRRYLADFDLDRIVAIDAVQPWWHETFDVYWDTGDEEAEERAEKIGAAGYKLWTMEDALSGGGIDVGKTRRLYERPGGGSGEYHGTISSAVMSAFHGTTVIPHEPPFPVGDPDELQSNTSGWRHIPDAVRLSVEGYDWLPTPSQIGKLFGTRVVRALGCGGGGCVVATARGTAVKITSDADEIAFVNAVRTMRQRGHALAGIVSFEEPIDLGDGVWAYERPALQFESYESDDGLNEAANVAVELLQGVRFGRKKLTAALFAKMAAQYGRALDRANPSHHHAVGSVKEMLAEGYLLADVVGGNIASDDQGRRVLYDASLVAVRPGTK